MSLLLILFVDDNDDDDDNEDDVDNGGKGKSGSLETSANKSEGNEESFNASEREIVGVPAGDRR